MAAMSPTLIEIIVTYRLPMGTDDREYAPILYTTELVLQIYDETFVKIGLKIKPPLI
jgi:hypothetical protein